MILDVGFFTTEASRVNQPAIAAAKKDASKSKGSAKVSATKAGMWHLVFEFAFICFFCLFLQTCDYDFRFHCGVSLLVYKPNDSDLLVPPTRGKNKSQDVTVKETDSKGL